MSPVSPPRPTNSNGHWWNLSTPEARLRLALGGLVGLLGVGTLGYYGLEEDFTLFDSFYQVVITVSTVGFSEIHELSTAGRALTTVLIISGLVLVAFATGSFLESVIEGGLGRYLGKRRLERQISTLSGHWIICGYGRMGEHVAQELEASKRQPKFVIVELHSERTRLCENSGYLYVQGDASQEELLLAAGIERARGLVSLVATDAVNVFICLTASHMNPDLKIIARSAEEGSEKKLLRAGATKVIAPYHVGGMRLSQAILRPAVQDFLDFTMGRDLEIELEEVLICEGSPLVGLTLRESPIRTELDLILVAVRSSDERMTFNPSADTVLNEGDTLIAVGAGGNLAKLQIRCGTRE
jgi:voltage-gated potassium channel